MHDSEYFRTTSLSYQLKAARRELSDFRSGEIYQKLRADYERTIRELTLTANKLRRERDECSFSRRRITRQWMDVLEDIQKEHEKEVKKLKETEYSNASEPPFYRLRATSDFNTLEPPQTQDIVMEP